MCIHPHVILMCVDGCYIAYINYLLETIRALSVALTACTIYNYFSDNDVLVLVCVYYLVVVYSVEKKCSSTLKFNFSLILEAICVAVLAYFMYTA